MRKFYRSLDVARQRYVGLPNVIGMGLGFKKKGQQETNELAVIFLYKKNYL